MMRVGRDHRWFDLEPDRGVLELDEHGLRDWRLALELEVHLVDGRSVAVWKLSETGRILVIVLGARA